MSCETAGAGPAPTKTALEFTDTTASEVNKLFPMSPGLHFIEVKARDADGHQVTESRTIDVHLVTQAEKQGESLTNDTKIASNQR